MDDIESLTPAPVLWWTGRTFRVLCPFCLESHGHGMRKDYEEISGMGKYYREIPDSRLADCGRQSYRVVWPDNEDSENGLAATYGWELNKRTGQIRLVTSDGLVKDPVERGNPPRRFLKQFEHLHRRSFHDSEEQNTEYEEETSQHGSKRDEDCVGCTTELLEKTQLSHSDSNPTQGKSPGPDRPDCESGPADLMVDKVDRMKLYLSSCILKNYSELEWLFATYPDDDFVNHTDEDGANGVLLAATEEGGLSTVQRLLQKGVPVDKHDHYGRTALMEAALWGHLEIVKYLIGNGANAWTADANSHQASDLASTAERNHEERISRASGVVREPNDANRKRSQIYALLRRKEKEICSKERELRREGRFTIRRRGQKIIPGTPDAEPPARPRDGYFQKLDARSLGFYQVDTVYALQDGEGNKAFGRLDRGPAYPVISAMSGYSQSYRKDTLNNSIWTARAQMLCKRIGHPTEKKEASHIEKQLLAYYMDRHYLFDREDDWSNESKNANESNEVARAYDISELREVLPTNLPQASITVNKYSVCDDCAKFCQKLLNTFPGVNIRIYPVGDEIRPDR